MWICKKCKGEEDDTNPFNILNHVHENTQPICPTCHLTKPCECDD